jgi:hypothetical protein
MERSNAVKEFLQRHASDVTGVLSGLDRLRLRGSLRVLCNVGGMMSFLSALGVLLKDFKQYSLGVTEQVRRSVLELAARAGKPVQFLPGGSQSKEDLARDIARREKIEQGPVCFLSAVEPCMSFEVYRNRDTRQIELRSGQRKCLHYYQYLIHPKLGFMNVRLQTWLPFTMHLCLNGREWLARDMDRAGLGYVRRDNCFTHLQDAHKAQALMDRQLHTRWRPMLDQIAGAANPVLARVLAKFPVSYYWSAQESEWATDVLFKDAATLGRLYPGLIRHGMQSLGGSDVMRFLGQKLTAAGEINRNFTGEVVSDLKRRPEGMRLKHRVRGNWVKMYDKQGSVLRVETVITEPREMKVYRPKEGDPKGKKAWRYMRRGVADLYRRGQVCQKSNERYLRAMASAQQNTPLAQVTEKLCRPATFKGRRVRALNPLGAEDAKLLEAVARGEFVLNGFRNRDLRPLLHGPAPADAAALRRQSAAVTRQLRLLRAHGLIRKVPRTHRYIVSDKGRTAITALLAARQADAATLAKAA